MTLLTALGRDGAFSAVEGISNTGGTIAYGGLASSCSTKPSRELCLRSDESIIHNAF